MKHLILILPLLLTACLPTDSGSSSPAAANLAPATPAVPTPTPASIPTTAVEIEAALVGTWLQQGNPAASITFTGRDVSFSSPSSSTHTKCLQVSATQQICNIQTSCVWTATSLTGSAPMGQLLMMIDVLTTSSPNGYGSITNCEQMSTNHQLKPVILNFISANCIEMSFDLPTTPYPIYCKQ